MALPVYILIVGAGISAVRRRGIQTTLLATVLFVNAFSLGNYYGNPRYAREDARSAAKYLESASRPQDIIVVVGSTTAVRYYYKGHLPIVSWSKEINADNVALTGRLKRLRENYHRLWLVEIRRWEKDPAGKVKEALEVLYQANGYHNFPGVEIHLYTL